MEILKKYPMYNFYKDNENILRVFGAVVYSQSKLKDEQIFRLQTIEAHNNWTNLIVNGWKVDNLIAYDKWPKADEDFIRATKCNISVFLDPCGFI